MKWTTEFLGIAEKQGGHTCICCCCSFSYHWISLTDFIWKSLTSYCSHWWAFWKFCPVWCDCWYLCGAPWNRYTVHNDPQRCLETGMFESPVGQPVGKEIHKQFSMSRDKLNKWFLFMICFLQKKKQFYTFWNLTLYLGLPYPSRFNQKKLGWYSTRLYFIHFIFNF